MSSPNLNFPMRLALFLTLVVIADGAQAQSTADVAACRDVKDSLLRLRCFDDVSAPVGVKTVAPAAKPTAPDFAQYPAEAYRGPVSLPDFRGRDRGHAMYRTRILEGAKAGPNFAGHLAMILIGCGAGCAFVPVVDLRTGRVLDFPLGGEDNLSLDLRYNAGSRLVSARYIADERCKSENVVWTGTGFQRGSVQDLGDREVCYQLAE